MGYFAVFEGGVLQKQGLKKFAQFRNIPLPVTQIIKKTPLGGLRCCLESFIKGRVCPEDIEVSIKNEKGLVRCIQNGLSIIEGQFRFIV